MNPAALLNPKKKKTQQQQNGASQKSPQAAQQPSLVTYNPQALLNPRGASRAHHMDDNSISMNGNGNSGSFTQPTSNQHHTPAQKFQFASEPSQFQDTQNTQTHQPPGLASMIERHHGVQNRDTPLSRKRHSDRTEHEGTPRQKAKGTFSSSGGGALSEHMKKEREKAASRPIDLTAEPEVEDVTFVKEVPKDNSAENEEVCLGQVFALAHMHLIPNVSNKAAAAVGKENWPKIRVNWQQTMSTGPNNIINLVTKSGSNFARIEPKTAITLARLLQGATQTKFRMEVNLETRKRSPGEYPGQPVSQQCKITCVLFCPRGKANLIGKYLSQHQLFLCDPLGAAYGKEVYNPQQPKVFGSRGAETQQRKTQSLQNQTIAVTSRTVEEQRRDLGNIMDGLISNEDMPEKDPDERYITTPLMSHQKQALKFLVDHELSTQDVSMLWKSEFNARGQEYWYNVITGHQLLQPPPPVLGGILADMMGLGKTLSILSLIAATREESFYFSKDPPPGYCKQNLKATLIICPKSVMSNWTEQIRAHTKPKTFKAYIYHGSSRTQDLAHLAKYSIVLTTYNTVAAELKSDKALASANWFRIVLDEAHTIRNQTTKFSKACIALSAQRRWAVTGTPIQNNLNDLGALVKFLRVKPFDEGQNWAQFIIAPFKLANTDVVSHLRALIASMTIRRVKDTIELCDKTIRIVRLQATKEEQKIYTKVSSDSNKKLRSMIGHGSGMLKGKSYAHVLKSLGRMRMICAHGIDMFAEQDRKEILEGMTEGTAIELGDDPDLEEETYKFMTDWEAFDALKVMHESDVDRCMKCDHRLIKVAAPVDSEDSEGDSDNEDEDEDEDAILGHITPCCHLICENCKDEHNIEVEARLKEDGYYRCQYCDTYMRPGLFEIQRAPYHAFVEARSAKKKGQRQRDESTYTGPHTKVRALLQELHASAQETLNLPPGEPPIRSVVFTGWTTYLDLIEIALDDAGFGYLRLDGSMSVRARSAVLEEFKVNSEKVILLVSIKAGGQGLNLTAASKAYMMEPQFNPGVEEQAIDRIHRLGQTRAVFITRFIMQETIEEGILALQKKKQDLAKLSMDRKISAQEVRKENLEALKELFK